MRMEQHRIPRKILEGRPVGRRSRKRSRQRLIKDVQKDLKNMGITGGRKLCNEGG